MVTCAAQTPKERRYLRGYLKRAAAVMMCCVLVFSFTFCSPSAPKAKAFVAESGFIGSFIGVVMSSMGYTWTANNMNEQGFGDALADVVQQYLDIEVGGLNIVDWANVVGCVQLSGNSSLFIQQELVKKISDFADWFTDKFGLVDDSPVPVYSQGPCVFASDGTPFYFAQLTGDYLVGDFTSLELDKLYSFSTGYSLLLSCAPSSSFKKLTIYQNGEVLCSGSFDKSYYAAVYLSGGLLWPVYYRQDNNYRVARITFGNPAPISYLNEVFGVLTPESALEVGKSPTAQNPDIADDGSQAYEVTLPNLTADDLEALISSAVAAALEGTLVAEGTVTDAVPIVSEGTMVGDISLEGIQAVQEDLSAVFISKFPFCIPWDFAKAVSLLAAPPQTPHWEVDFFGAMNGQYGVNWQGDTKIVIDFAEFELLGIVCRWTSTLMFCFVLITSTKRLIWTA